jgi:hypothetical protein
MSGTMPCRALVEAAPLPTRWKMVELPSTPFFTRTVGRSFEP